MFFYAQECPRGCRTAMKGDRLYRFASSAARNTWVLSHGRDLDSDQTRAPLSREDARRWYPRAFKDAPTFPKVNASGDYWDDCPDDGAMWSGLPTGGIYSETI